MTVELATYGFVAGYARQGMRLRRVASAALAIVAGRLVFIGAALLTGAAKPTFAAYASAALLPGIAAAIVQMGALPAIASWWVRNEKSR